MISLKKLFSLLFILLIIFSINCTNEKAHQTVSLSKIRVGVQNSSVSSLVFIAKQSGFFIKNGLDVTIIRYPSGKVAFQGMLKGETDLSTVADIPVMIGAVQNKKFKILCSIAETQTGAWIIARKDKGIHRIVDLKGKIIGTQLNSAVHYFLHIFLNKYDLHDHVTVKYMPAKDLPGSFERGELDAFSMRNPFISEAKNKVGESNTTEFFEEDLYLQNFLLTVNEDFIKGNENNIISFLKSLIDAENFIINNESDSIGVLVKALDEKRKEEIVEDWKLYKLGISLKQYLVYLLEDEADFASLQKIVEKDKMTNFLKFIQSGFLKNIDPGRVTLIQ